uniref:Uncharacterized protein n=1 Tax=Equus caballus TaxID=9796 RepID=A0A9L0REH6_HORSE
VPKRFSSAERAAMAEPKKKSTKLSARPFPTKTKVANQETKNTSKTEKRKLCD